MDVDVPVHPLSPRMQHHDRTELDAKPLGRFLRERLPGRAEQQAVEKPGVYEDNRKQRSVRERKDAVQILNR